MITNNTRNDLFVSSKLFLIMIVLVVFIVTCSPAKKKTIEPVNHTKSKCGECLDMPLGEVCTASGTKRNSCMAICGGVKILCFQACPCPKDN